MKFEWLLALIEALPKNYGWVLGVVVGKNLYKGYRVQACDSTPCPLHVCTS